MAIIYTYPELTTLQGSDLLLISDTSASNATKSVTLTNIAAFLAAGGTGTTDTLTMWVDGPAGLIGDSLIAQDAGATTVTITGATVSTGQVTIPLTPVAATDAASKGYVDAEVATFIFTQAVSANPWVVVHNLGKYPSVTVTDSNVIPRVVVAQVDYDNTNQVTITFAGAQAGNAYLN